MAINIKPADRISNVSEYYFSKKLKEIAKLNAEGKDIISLGIGSPDMPPSEQTIEALCDDARKADAHGYQSYIGIPELRQAFATFYKKNFGVELNPANEIQPLMGSKEGVMHISLAFLNKGDEVLVPNPGYPTYSSVSNIVEAKIINYDLDENNGWQPDFEKLESMDLSRVKLMWVNYPNMPTGARATKELFEKLVDFGRRHNIIIVNDNPYSFILNNEKLSILSIPGAKDICIELNSLSKSHNMPGWRMAMVASNPQFIEWILRIKSNMDSGMFRPMQKAAVAAMSNDDEWHEKHNIELYAKRRALAEEIMTTLGCSFDKDQVGMFLWGKIPSKYESSAELADRVLYDARVFITPGFIFGSNGEKYVRISLCSKEDKLQNALDRIKENIK
ncbi:MAG: aminotransferase class I/II-fold pyridoxal phosphate-dependent enzyme [Paludibacteraceae bacterium]|jgi:aspartate/methionine/tyrosine aminotransferase|nr:aminotransferase class I/II-fold pyridoxal phosphate-dependent enzyme [Paludibacteraceae bacterium]MBQ3896617.1 aminotransferase class I/II-fold pyridoxal phosphate-dependent enzyme [Paludibacteraceae bacterium]